LDFKRNIEFFEEDRDLCIVTEADGKAIGFAAGKRRFFDIGR